jgi:hypothetical protein
MNMPKYDSIFNSEEYTEEPLNEAEGLASIVLIAALSENPKDLVAPDLFLDILADFDLYVEYSEEDLLSMVDRLTGIAASQVHYLTQRMKQFPMIWYRMLMQPQFWQK